MKPGDKSGNEIAMKPGDKSGNEIKNDVHYLFS